MKLSKFTSLTLLASTTLAGSAFANDELANLSANPANWAMQAGNFANHRSSELSQINKN